VVIKSKKYQVPGGHHAVFLYVYFSITMTTKAKTWQEKLNVEKPIKIEVLQKKFADIPEGGRMLIVTPKMMDAYVRQIPKGKSVTTATIRRDLAAEHNADYTCPVTTGIFLRIVAEAAYEKIQQGGKPQLVTPFWRAIEPNSPLAKKLTFGQEFLLQQRKAEGLGDMLPRPGRKRAA
jgi:hypothetical protein